MKNYIILSLKNNKLSNFFLFICLFFVLLIIVVLTNFKLSFYKYLTYITENYYDARKIEAVNLDLTYEEMETQIRQIDHVADVFFFNDYRTGFDIKSSNESLLERMYVAPAGEGYMPQAIKGKNIEEETDLICPIKLANSGTNGFNTEFINMEDYLGKNITLTKDVYYLEKMGQEPVVIETKEYQFKIVGLYDYSAFGDEPYYCYTFKDVIGNIVKETNPIYADDYWPDNYLYESGPETGIFPYIDIIVDKNENVSYVENELEKLGFQHSTMFFIDYEFFDTVNILFNIVLVFILIIFGLLFYTFLSKNMKKRYNELWILKAIGYNDNQITKIVLYNAFIIFCISFFLSIIFSLIINYFINTILSNNAQLIGLVIKNNYLAIFLIFIAFILEFIWFNYRLKSKVKVLLRRKTCEN